VSRNLVLRSNLVRQEEVTSSSKVTLFSRKKIDAMSRRPEGSKI
jgi:hypothetical protein